jgi:hypothetical protein
MIRRFPVAIAATILALSLTASASILGDSQLGQVAEQLKTALAGPIERAPARQDAADAFQAAEYEDCCGRLHRQRTGRGRA